MYPENRFLAAEISATPSAAIFLIVGLNQG
jgi:hypothetical protein